MQTLEKTEFTNRNKDKVSIVLLGDSFDGFHLIVKVSMMRSHPEKRVVGGKLIEIPTTTWNQETKLVQLPDKGTALNEFHLYRLLENEPGFTSADYSAWQATQKEEI